MSPMCGRRRRGQPTCKYPKTDAAKSACNITQDHAKQGRTLQKAERGKKGGGESKPRLRAGGALGQARGGIGKGTKRIPKIMF